MACRRILTTSFSALLVGLLIGAPAYGQSADWIRLVGYGDHLSVQQGETIRFMVSSELPPYRADIVRLIHGDTNPKGPGFKEELVDAPVNKEYPGRHQDLPSGSYVIVPDNPALRPKGSFTLQAWVAPTTPQKRVQGIVTKWSASDRVGYGALSGRGWQSGALAGRTEREDRESPVRQAAPGDDCGLQRRSAGFQDLPERQYDRAGISSPPPSTLEPEG